jgi:hypothetical protein
MGVKDTKDIKGMWIGNVLICSDCLTEEEWKNLNEDKLFSADKGEENGEKLYLCDRCHKRP